MKTTKSRKKKIVQSQQILYKCHICEKDFEQYEFKDHIGNCTKNDVVQGDPHGLNTILEDKEQHKCLICDKNFDTEQNFRQHLSTVCEKIRKKHKCGLCQMSFTRGTKFKEHIQTVHEGQKDFWKAVNEVEKEPKFALIPNDFESNNDENKARKGQELETENFLEDSKFGQKLTSLVQKKSITVQNTNESKQTKKQPSEKMKINEDANLGEKLTSLVQKYNLEIIKNPTSDISSADEIKSDIFEEEENVHEENENSKTELSDDDDNDNEYIHEGNNKSINEKSFSDLGDANEMFMKDPKITTNNVTPLASEAILDVVLDPICASCGNSYSKKDGIVSHIRTFHGGRGKLFSSEMEVEMFVSVLHERNKNLTCDFCGRQFSFPDHSSGKKSYKSLWAVQQLMNHIQSIHQKKKDFVCPICIKGFGSQDTLRTHIRLKHEERKIDFKCESCGKAFPFGFMLKKHKYTTHEGHKDFICETCGKAFIGKPGLKNHLKIYKGKKHEKTYLCNTCGKAFSEEKGLNYHSGVHKRKKHEKNSTILEPEEKYCLTCNEMFDNEKKLKQHCIAIHNKFKTYQCKRYDCQAVLSDGNLLKKHIYDVHGKNEKV